MTDTVTIALATATPLLMAQAVNLWISYQNGKRAKAIAEEAKGIKEEAKVISGHVNSAASAAAAKIDAMEKQINELKLMLAERKETAALLAQAAATEQVANVANVVKQALVSPAAPLPVEVVNTHAEPVPTVPINNK